MADHPGALLNASAEEIARLAGVSDATVIRTIQKLGYEGLPYLKLELQASAIGHNNPDQTVDTGLLTTRADVDRVVDYVLDESQQSLRRLAQPSTRLALARSTALLTNAKRIGIMGRGASAIMAQYGAWLFVRHGIPAYPIIGTGPALEDELIMLAAGDALILAIRDSSHRELAAAMNEAIRLGIPTIIMTEQPRHVLTRACAETIVLPDARANGSPLCSSTLTCLEMLALGAAALRPR